ncbi:MAG TPA: hypothetical protein VGG14_12570 [Candidatus Sulfotelmatobacter sp.]
MNRLVTRAGVIALLASLLASHAAALCPMSSAPSSLPPCHLHHHVPAQPYPAEHQCCVARAPSALPSNVFPAAPAFQPVRVDEVVVPARISNTSILPPEIVLAFGPPATIALRI